jgi:4-deoxy-L-threo-5-hexosulose-uronate ketol-isomerase
MDTRYSANPQDLKRYTTEELRKEFLIQNLYQADTVQAVYSHVDRMVTLGIMPVEKEISIDEGMDVWHTFGVKYFLERREVGFFNIGGEGHDGQITVDGTTYDMAFQDCIYITKGAKEVHFKSKNPQKPARFYGVSAPAHVSFETKLLTFQDANKKPLGEVALANKRVINQFIHPDVIETAQLSMGLTQLDEGSVWNTMPTHTHERRMEIYTYFNIPENNVVFHMMGQPDETRHIVMQNYDAVISPSYSIHSGVGTSNYTFIWAMGGENQEFDDMDHIQTTDLK